MAEGVVELLEGIQIHHGQVEGILMLLLLHGLESGPQRQAIAHLGQGVGHGALLIAQPLLLQIQADVVFVLLCAQQQPADHVKQHDQQQGHAEIGSSGGSGQYTDPRGVPEQKQIGHRLAQPGTER